MAGRAGKRKPVPRQSSFRNVALLILVPIVGFACFLAYRFFRDQLIQVPLLPRRGERAEGARPRRAPVTPAPERPETTKTAIAPKRHHGEIALILDDVGFDHQPLASAMKIEPNFSFSILPNAANAAAFAEELHRNGFQVLCHLPMEPVGYPRESPGPNAIMTSMDDAQIAETTRQDIADVPHAVGVNNHMGSRATCDVRVMTGVLRALPHGMFFIDSRTTSGSIAEQIARQMKVPTAARNVFLDDVQNETAVRRQLASLAAAAQRDGIAIGIGHMYPVTVKVLTEDVPVLRSNGFRFVRASDAVE